MKFNPLHKTLDKGCLCNLYLSRPTISILQKDYEYEVQAVYESQLLVKGWQVMRKEEPCQRLSNIWHFSV